MSDQPQAPYGSDQQARAAAPGPAPLLALEQLARRELARLQAQQPPACVGGEDEMLLALAWDLGLSGEELLRG